VEKQWVKEYVNYIISLFPLEAINNTQMGGAWKKLFKSKEAVRVLMLGLDNSGKTSTYWREKQKTNKSYFALEKQKTMDTCHSLLSLLV